MGEQGDVAFGEAAVARGIITKVQLEECLKAQALVTQAGLRRSLADIMIERGFTNATGMKLVRMPAGEFLMGFALDARPRPSTPSATSASSSRQGRLQGTNDIEMPVRDRIMRADCA